MELNDNRIKKIYKPYVDEALYCLIIDILIVILGGVIILFLDKNNIVKGYLWIILFYPILECFFCYRIALLAFIEKRYLLYDKKKVKIVSIQKEYSLSGRQGKSVVNKLYSEKLQVNRCKIVCESEGKKVGFRSIMSSKKVRMIEDFVEENKNSLIIIEYGKLTKIVYLYKQMDDKSLDLNYYF